jgi:hypothetical protein
MPATAIEVREVAIMAAAIELVRSTNTSVRSFYKISFFVELSLGLREFFTGPSHRGEEIAEIGIYVPPVNSVPQSPFIEHVACNRSKLV